MTKDQLLSLRKKPEPVPGVPGVFVRVMTGAETFAWYAAGRDHADDAVAIAAALVVRSACDEAGVRLFADGDTADAAGLDGPVFKALQEAASRVNGLSEAGREDARKNSDSPASASSSGSPGTSESPSAS